MVGTEIWYLLDGSEPGAGTPQEEMRHRDRQRPALWALQMTEEVEICPESNGKTWVLCGGGRFDMTCVLKYHVTGGKLLGAKVRGER